MSDGMNMPSQKVILDMIDSLTDISDAEKEELKREIIGGAGAAAKAATATATAAAAATSSGWGSSPEILFVLPLFLVVALVIGAISFELIMREKARLVKKVKKREEKMMKRTNGADAKQKAKKLAGAGTGIKASTTTARKKK